MNEWIKSLVYDEARLANALRGMSPSARARFACACAERLMPTYKWYCSTTDSPSYRMVREALDTGWAAASVQDQAAVDLELLHQRVVASMPDAENSGPFIGSVIAGNAVACVAYALEACLTGDVQASVWAARQLYNAADSVVQQGSAVHTYITDISREPPVQMMVRGIAVSLDDVGSSNADDLRAKAQGEGERFLSLVTGQAWT